MLGDWCLGHCPILCASFVVMIHDSIVSLSSWERKSVTLGIQVPLSGLVVRGTVLELHGESGGSMSVNKLKWL